MTAHAKLSPSSAARWLACPASVAMESHIPETRASAFAAQGTCAHELAERCLRLGTDTRHYRDEELAADGFTFSVDAEMVEAVQAYIGFVRDHLGRRFIEHRVDFSRWVPDGFGTSDAIILHDTVLTVIDLKYGRGVRVMAQENPQAMCYALGALDAFDHLYDIRRIRMVIHQPRLDQISEWEIDRRDLLDWAETVLAPGAAATLVADALFNPGETQCRFCRAAGQCRALVDHSLSVAAEGFTTAGDPVRLSDAASLTPDALASILSELDTITAWTKSVKAHAQTLIEQGEGVPGWKLVRGRGGHRVWSDTDEAEAVLRKLARAAGLKVPDLFTKTLISPAQAEKKLGARKDRIAGLVVKPEGAPTLAPISDPRARVETDPTAGFSNVT